MLKKYLALVFFITFFIGISFAQSKPTEKNLSLRSISNIGLLNGSQGPSVSLQTILGVAFKNTFAGAGIAIDYYRFRSIPIFLDLRHEFGKGERNFFIYGDLGYNHDWLTEKNKDVYYFSSTTNYKGGIYYDAGIGYKVAFKNKNALLLSAGYTVKKIESNVISPFCPFIGPCTQEAEKYVYELQRIVVKAGWSF